MTVRYDDPRPFAIVEHKLARACPPKVSGETVMMDLLDAVIDRAADIQERIGAEVDQISHSIFEPDDEMDPPSYNDVLKALGRKGDLTSKVRESQVSVGRLLSFLAHEAEVMKWAKDMRTQLQSMQRDVVSLTDHASYLSNKITFLLDAMLGVVNIQQNAIIKIFSIAAVVFMPPTLVASIYGMNFHTRHDRARLEIRLPVRARFDRARGCAAAAVLQVEEVAVRLGYGGGRHVSHCLGISDRRRVICAAAAKDVTIGSVSVSLPPPPGFCELDRAQASDARMITFVEGLLSPRGNRLLNISAQCEELKDWRSGKRKFIDNFSQHQAPLADESQEAPADPAEIHKNDLRRHARAVRETCCRHAIRRQCGGGKGRKKPEVQ